MNPEEGELRPQLRDRFALQTEVTGCEDIADRVAIIDRALDDDADGSAADPARPAEERLREAGESLSEVELAPSFREQIAELCRDAGVDGHRGDIATARAARVFAALDGRTTVLESDVERAAEFALPHRLQSDPFDAAPDVDDVIDDHFEDEETESGESGDDESGQDEASEDEGQSETGEGETDSSETDEGEGGSEEEPEGSDESDGAETEQEGDSPENNGDGGENSGSNVPAEADDGVADEGSDDCGGESDAHNEDSEEDEAAPPLLPGQSRADVGESTSPDMETPSVDTDGSQTTGSANAASGATGPTVRTEPAENDDDVDVAASVRAAAKRGSHRVGSRDLRQSVKAGDAGTLVVFAVDASASMRPAMRAAKGTVIELLKDAYQARDEVAVVTFAGDSADVVLPPTDSVSLAARHLKELPTGDRTPLPDGLTTAAEVLQQADPDAAIAVVVTDGRANTADGSPVAATRDAAGGLGAVADRTIVVDAGTESDSRAGLTDIVAEATDGSVVPLSALTAEHIDSLAGR